MFRVCSSLTTIFCDQTWNIPTATGMFQGDDNLVGAVAYDNGKTNGDMANPIDGYFTGSQAITVDIQGNGTIAAPDKAFPTLTVTFTAQPAPLCSLTSITVTGNNTGNTIETTLNNGVYSFIMPGEPVTITAVFSTPQGEVPAVLWCDDNSTLYFVNVPYEAMSDGTWDGQHITQSWSGNVVNNTGWTVPGWEAVKDKATRVVFDESFATATPKSCYAWFYLFKTLTSIEGLENLNTSEVTNMNTMFYGCEGLTTLDVNSFYVSKVTNATGMFRSCTNLTTIYCDNTWEITTSQGMFLASSSLMGAVAYNVGQTNAAMANPRTGYFTGKWSVNIPSSFEHGTVTCEKDWAYTNETVTLTVIPDEGYSLESLTVETIDDSEPSGAMSLAPGKAAVNVAQGDELGTYTFKMPPASVIVNATFKQHSIITGVDNLNINQQRSVTRYNLMGLPVGDDYKGIVIENGVKKVMR